MSGRLKASLAVAAALGLGVLVDWSWTPRGTSLTFLSVGQGDCAVLQHDGWVAMIDAGPRTEWFDGGERLVAPGMRRLGVRKVDLVVLSHPDGDHIGGLRAVARRWPVGKVCVPARFRDHQGLQEELRRCGFRREQLVWVSGRTHAKLGRFWLEMEAPQGTEGMGDNDGSMFCRVNGMGCRAVFSGDAGPEVEKRMSESGEWRAEVLKAGHHGSGNATSAGWLREVNPRYVVVSVGRANMYGHPSSRTLGRIAGAKAEALRTDRAGTIRFRPGKSGFEPER